MRKIIGVGILVLVAISAFRVFARPAEKEEGGYILKPGARAADFSVELLDGRQVKLSAQAGKVVLVTFWATWCSSCLEELHHLPAALKPYEDKDFVWLPISRGETRKAVQKRMSKLNDEGITFVPGLDADKSIWNKYATIYIPKNFLIDKKGIVRYVSTGYDQEKLKELTDEMDVLLKE